MIHSGYRRVFKLTAFLSTLPILLIKHHHTEDTQLRVRRGDAIPSLPAVHRPIDVGRRVKVVAKQHCGAPPCAAERQRAGFGVHLGRSAAAKLEWSKCPVCTAVGMLLTNADQALARAHSYVRGSQLSRAQIVRRTQDHFACWVCSDNRYMAVDGGCIPLSTETLNPHRRHP